ncbi:MAG: dihydroflavonol-4-reductase [Thermoanaerobaculia bacterium]|nr:dihydroflavonol-4-reductase [Thermoanaerobaculia bacterium]
MKVFVTGGNGFIGSVVVRSLVHSGHEVTCLLRAHSRTDRIDGLPYTRVLGDVRDAASLGAAMKHCDATIHLAGLSSWSEIDSPALGEVVEGGTRNILDEAAKLPGHRVVAVSSATAINGSEEPTVFDETAEFTLTDPKLQYAHAKRRAEELCIAAYRKGVAVIMVNPAEVYGPADDALITAGNLIDFVKSNPVLVCNGGTSVVHVADVAAGIVAALEKGKPGERYILGGENLTIRQLAELSLQLAGKRAKIVSMPNGLLRFISKIALKLHIPLPYNPRVIPYATRYWFVDGSKAERDLGVMFRGARETIQPTIAWLKEAGLVA